MTEVIMPKMGDGMEEGTLLEWLKKDGEKVKSGEVIGTIQTDKATLELESPGSGTLTGFLIGPGETVPVGRPIALILRKDEAKPADWGKPGASASVQASDSSTSDAAEEAAGETESPAAAGDLSRIKASPLARKIAMETGVNLLGVTGTGPGGRITEKDVKSAVSSQGAVLPASAPAAVPPAPAPAAAVAPAGPAPVLTPVSTLPPGQDIKVPLSRLRAIIAQRTQQSKQEAPHFYVTVEVDLEAIAGLRDMFKSEQSGAVSVNDFVVRAVALALRQMPEVNATFMGDHVQVHGAVNVGIAAAVPDGLLVPVMHSADQLTLRQIAAKSKELVARAREGKLGLDEMTGSTFSISNMGMLNVDNFAAIINGPNAGIIAISSARKIPVVVDGDKIEARTRMNITGSFDHRVLDGAVGAAFMNVVRDYLQNPTRLLS